MSTSTPRSPTSSATSDAAKRAGAIPTRSARPVLRIDERDELLRQVCAPRSHRSGRESRRRPAPRSRPHRSRGAPPLAAGPTSPARAACRCGPNAPRGRARALRRRPSPLPRQARADRSSSQRRGRAWRGRRPRSADRQPARAARGGPRRRGNPEPQQNPTGAARVGRGLIAKAPARAAPHFPLRSPGGRSRTAPRGRPESAQCRR